MPAKSVYVAGDFNQWDPTATKMTKTKDGSFKAKLKLTHGKHQYKFCEGLREFAQGKRILSVSKTRCSY
jgi:1,4-alpha-glucan branching enzyme